jgi:hypothetical protein
VTPVQKLFIRSTNLLQYDSRESIIETDVNSDIIGVIPITNQPGAWISMQGNTFTSRVNNQSIDGLEIYLSDDQNYTLDLGGLDWSFRMTITELNDGHTIMLRNLTQTNTEESTAPLIQKRQELLDELAQIRKELEQEQDQE